MKNLIKKFIYWFKNKRDERSIVLALLIFALAVIILSTAEGAFWWVVTKIIIWVGSFFLAGFYLCVGIFLFMLAVSWVLQMREKLCNQIRKFRKN